MAGSAEILAAREPHAGGRITAGLVRMTDRRTRCAPDPRGTVGAPTHPSDTAPGQGRRQRRVHPTRMRQGRPRIMQLTSALMNPCDEQHRTAVRAPARVRGAMLMRTKRAEGPREPITTPGFVTRGRARQAGHMRRILTARCARGPVADTVRLPLPGPATGPARAVAARLTGSDIRDPAGAPSTARVTWRPPTRG